jgi:RHS repeat-associated protein
MERIRFSLLFLFLSIGLVSSSRAEQPKVKVIAIEAAMRAWQERYHTATPFYAYWYARSDKKEPGNYPEDCFYGADLLDPQKAAKLVNNLLDEMRYQVAGNFAVSEADAWAETRSAIRWEGASITHIAAATPETYVAVFTEIVKVLRKCNIHLIETTTINESHRGLASFVGSTAAPSCEDAKTRLITEYFLNKHVITPTSAGLYLTVSLFHNTLYSTYHGHLTSYTGRYLANLTRHTGAATLYVREYRVPDGSLTGPATKIASTTEPASVGELWKSKVYGWESIPPTLDCPDTAPYKSTQETRYFRARLAAKPAYQYHVEDVLVECDPCSTCQTECVPSQLDCLVSSLDARVALGEGPNGSAGALTIKADTPSPLLATPHALRKKLRAGARAILDHQNPGPDGYPVLRQIAASQAFVDIVTQGSFGYEIRFYKPDQQGALNSDGFYEPVGTPFRLLKVENPDQSATEFNRLRITGTGDGGLDVATFVYDPPTRGWTLTREKDGTTIVESRSSVIDASTQRRTEIHRKLGSNGEVVLDEKNAYQVFPWNLGPHALRTEELIETTKDPIGAALKTTYEFYTDQAVDGPNYGKVRQQIDADGSWQEFHYDAAGRVTRLITPFLNAPPGATVGVRIRESAWSSSLPNETVVESLVLPDASKVELSRSYRNFNYNAITTYLARNPGAPWGDPSNLVSITRSDNTGQFNGRATADIRPDGTGTLYAYQTNADGSFTTTTHRGALNAAKTAVVAGTRSVSTQSNRGEIVDERVYDITSGLLLSMRIVTETDVFGRATRIDYLDGTHEERAYGCCGLEYAVDREGIRTDYGYDAFRRVMRETRAGITLHYTYDGAGRRLTTMREGSDGTFIQLESNRYDAGGRLLSTTGMGGRITVFDETTDSTGQTIRTTTGPDQATRIETSALDGSLLSIGGTAVAPRKHEYGADANGSFVKVVHVGSGGEESEWVKTYTNMLGQVTQTVYPDGAAHRMFYNALGRLVREVDPDGVTLLYDYDAQGTRNVTAIDMDGNNTIDFSGIDRVSRTHSEVTTRMDVVVQRTTSSVWETNGQDTPSVTSIAESSVDGLSSWLTHEGLTSSTSVVYDSAGRRTATQQTPDGRKTIHAYFNGRLDSITSQTSAGEQLSATSYVYDPHGRLLSATHTGIGTTHYSYYPDDQIHSETSVDPDTARAGVGYDPQVTIYHYDAAGRPDDITLPDGTHQYTSYWLTGQVNRTWGSRTYPAGYTYDSQGRVKTLTTWQNHAAGTGAAITTWNYDNQRGWLLNKQDNDNRGPAYAYTKAGRLKTRTWARILNDQYTTTTYGYDRSGNLETTDYSETTPDVTISYDRSGRIQTTMDAAGMLSRTYNHGHLDDETYSGSGVLAGLSVERTTDALQRPQLLAATALTAMTFGYDDAGRLETITQGARKAVFGYKPDTGSHTQTTIMTEAGEPLTFNRSTDNLGRVSNISTDRANSDILSATRYTYNGANQSILAEREDNFRWTYNYDALGQVTTVEKRLADGITPLAGHSFTYDYDDIGNRRTTLTNGRTSTYTATLLNSYQQRTVSAAVDVMGAAAADATVTVNFQPTVRQGEAFHQAIGSDNTASPQLLDLKVVGVKNHVGPDGEDAVSEITRQAFVPRTPEVFTHDEDGNLIQDGRWDYSWDAENRLVAMETRAAVASAYPSLKKRLEFAYDYLGRRIRKVVKTWVNDTWEPLADTRFLYDGWNLLGEYTYTTTPQLMRSYVWGLDLSGDRYGGGGVGGLLWATDATTAYSPAYDRTGNVMAWIDLATGAIAGRYDYGAFGERVQINGDVAALLPFRFSTKYMDVETDLYYYGLRYYNTNSGRWLSKDPVEEEGGIALYAFVQNNPIDEYDILGMWGTSGHTTIASRWLGKYSDYKWIEGSSINVVGLIDLGSQKIDGDTGSSRDFLNAQSQVNSYQHAMRSPLQSKASAKAEMDKFVREKANAARNLAIIARRECNVEKLKQAIIFFGEAMHPVMDSTSPSHSGFQVWFGPSWFLLNPGIYASFVANHHYKETDADLNGILASVIAAMRSHDGEIDEILKHEN